MTGLVCRACKKRPVPDRKPLYDESKAESDEERQQLRETNEERDRRVRGLCWECSSAKTTASIDQHLAYFKEKAALGQCIAGGCSEPIHERDRCLEHRIPFDGEETV